MEIKPFVLGGDNFDVWVCTQIHAAVAKAKVKIIAIVAVGDKPRPQVTAPGELQVYGCAVIGTGWRDGRIRNVVNNFLSQDQGSQQQPCFQRFAGGGSPKLGSPLISDSSGKTSEN